MAGSINCLWRKLPSFFFLGKVPGDGAVVHWWMGKMPWKLGPVIQSITGKQRPQTRRWRPGGAGRKRRETARIHWMAGTVVAKKDFRKLGRARAASVPTQPAAADRMLSRPCSCVGVVSTSTSPMYRTAETEEPRSPIDQPAHGRWMADMDETRPWFLVRWTGRLWIGDRPRKGTAEME